MGARAALTAVLSSLFSRSWLVTPSLPTINRCVENVDDDDVIAAPGQSFRGSSSSPPCVCFWPAPCLVGEEEAEGKRHGFLVLAMTHLRAFSRTRALPRWNGKAGIVRTVIGLRVEGAGWEQPVSGTANGRLRSL